MTILKRTLKADGTFQVPAQRKLHDADRGLIRIEDASTQATANRVSFHFPRTEDTHQLIRALVHHDIEGGGSWQFPGAERYKRIVASWLRKQQSAMLAALDPQWPACGYRPEVARL